MNCIELPQNKGCITHDETRRVILLRMRITDTYDSKYGDVFEKTFGDPDVIELRGNGNNRILLALWYDANQSHFQSLQSQLERKLE